MAANPAVIEALQTSTPFLVLTAGLLGLIVGSFLNVIIHRLPLMMEFAWRKECREILELQSGDTQGQAPPIGLWKPRSHCPECKSSIPAYHNIPVLSWLLLRGRCAHCGACISIRYPVIELLSGLACTAVAWRFGFSLETGAAIMLTWALICLAAIDLRTHFLPDVITLPFLWLGLVLSPGGYFGTTPTASIIGAAAGYLTLWSIYHLFRLLTGKEGMGYGDFKLLALFGAWLGWQHLFTVVILSSGVGALVGIALIASGRLDRENPIPFGPFIAAAGWLTLMAGNEIAGGYMTYAGLA